MKLRARVNLLSRSREKEYLLIDTEKKTMVKFGVGTIPGRGKCKTFEYHVNYNEYLKEGETITLEELIHDITKLYTLDREIEEYVNDTLKYNWSII